MSALRMKTLVPAIYSLSSSVCKNQVKVASSYHMASQFRYISRTAYVAEEAKTTTEASDRVKKLTEEILALNVLEVNQLLFSLQVSSYSFAFWINPTSKTVRFSFFFSKI